MSAAAPLQTQAAKLKPLSNSTRSGLLLQRQCACAAATSSLTGECAECRSKKVLQTKLTIGASNDPLEAEADRVADQVITKRPLGDAGQGPVRIQRVTSIPAAGAAAAPPSVDRELSRGGQRLAPDLRGDMEQRFGHDFSNVRIHADAEAAASAHALRANAFTVGSQIVFGRGQYAPESPRGRRLLVHELTHVVQQSTGAPQRIARQPTGEPPETIHPDAMKDLNARLNAFYKQLTPAQRYGLHRYSTVAIAVVTEGKDGASQPRLVFTTPRNRGVERLGRQAEKVAVTPMNARGRTEGRGIVGHPNGVMVSIGAPEDAEQLLLDGARANRFKVWGMVVSRPMCHDCAKAVDDMNTANPRFKIQVDVAGDPAFAPGGEFHTEDGSPHPEIRKEWEREKPNFVKPGTAPPGEEDSKTKDKRKAPAQPPKAKTRSEPPKAKTKTKAPEPPKAKKTQASTPPGKTATPATSNVVADAKPARVVPPVTTKNLTAPATSSGSKIESRGSPVSGTRATPHAQRIKSAARGAMGSMWSMALAGQLSRVRGAELEKAQAALAALEETIEQYRQKGIDVTVTIIAEIPKQLDLMIPMADVNPSQVVWYREMFISHLSLPPSAATSTVSSIYDAGGHSRDHVGLGDMTLDQQIRFQFGDKDPVPGTKPRPGYKFAEGKQVFPGYAQPKAAKPPSPMVTRTMGLTGTWKPEFRAVFVGNIYQVMPLASRALKVDVDASGMATPRMTLGSRVYAFENSGPDSKMVMTGRFKMGEGYPSQAHWYWSWFEYFPEKGLILELTKGQDMTNNKLLWDALFLWRRV